MFISILCRLIQLCRMD